jgi:hypothetical protein
MFNDLRSYALGSHAWFFPAGAAFTSPAAGTVAVDAMPDKNDPKWPDLNIGDIEDWSDKKNEDTEETFRPGPGLLKRKEIITFFQSLDMELTTNSLKRIAMQIMYGSDTTLDDTHGQFAPLSAVPPEGWLKLQRYTQDDELVFAADLWVRLDVTDAASGNKKIVKPKFMAKLLDSDLNTMFFGDSSLLV